MSDIAIRVEGLSKKYRIGVKVVRNPTLRDAITRTAGAPVRMVRRLTGRDPNEGGDPGHFWALKDISFDVQRGELVGLIGRNGAGKSTLLKVLTRITEPTEGWAEIRGRVGSLLEVGTGFHPELSGRENVFLNGAILGMRRAEIDRRFDEIIAFAEVEKFVDTPVKHYSSGMYLRLAFAVAAFLESEILLVDEVLAVGDAQFQKKCLGKMQDVVGQGRTVLFVSHNMAAIQSLCTRGILLRQGQVVMDGDVDDVVGEYLGYLSASAVDAFGDNPERSGNGDIRLTGARVLDEQGRPSSHLVAGRPATFEFPYVNHSHIRKGFLTVTLLNQLGIAATCIDTDMTGGVCGGFADAGVLRCHVPSLPLPCGEYRAATLIRAAMRTADLVPNALVFSVVSSVYYPSGKVPPIKDCACMIPHEWEHQVQAQETTAVS